MKRSFAPSEYHLRRLARVKPRLRWREGLDFSAWQTKLRKKLFGLIGGWPRKRGDLAVEYGETVRKDGYTQQRLVFRSEPGADVPGYLLVPDGLGGPRPGMVCVQGHSPGVHISIGEAHTPKDEESLAGGDRDFAVQAARRGLVALAIEQRSFGERRETIQEQRSPHGCFDAVMHAFELGSTMVAERTWDASRALDLLASRPEVDAGALACMGNSGGGATTFYLACLDERVRVAVPSCVFCTYADSLMRIYHCADNYIPGVLKTAEMGDLAGLIAPRHVVFVAGEKDEIFPIAGTRRAFETAQAIYAAAGASEACELVVGPEGHRFYAEPAWPRILAALEA